MSKVHFIIERSTTNLLSIFIDDILHISVRTDNVDFVHSYEDNERYFIEYYLNNGSKIVTDYDTHELWVKILNILNKPI